MFVKILSVLENCLRLMILNLWCEDADIMVHCFLLPKFDWQQQELV